MITQPLIVAHRGASRDAPENTIPSFNLAWEQGADAIEGDFHLSRDGQIVCIHDRDTKRLTGKRRAIKDFTLDELKSLDVGAWFGAAFKGTQIPTLAEVFSTIPQGKGMFLLSGSAACKRQLSAIAGTAGGKDWTEAARYRG